MARPSASPPMTRTVTDLPLVAELPRAGLSASPGAGLRGGAEALASQGPFHVQGLQGGTSVLITCSFSDTRSTGDRANAVSVPTCEPESSQDTNQGGLRALARG